MRFIEVRWCLHAQGKEEDVSNCPQAEHLSDCSGLQRALCLEGTESIG